MPQSPFLQSPQVPQRNVDHLVDMLRAACENAGMNKILEQLLSQPEERRHLLVRDLLTEFRARNAPQELIAAFTPLLDDDVADTAWRVLYRCGASL